MQNELKIKDQSGNSYNHLLQDGFSLSVDDLEGEVWTDVIGYDGVYNVSNYGRIKSIPRYVNSGYGGQRLTKMCIIKSHESKSHLQVPLCMNGIEKTESLSNLVYLSFNKNSPKRPNEVVMHIDKNFRNNFLNNLKIESCKESTNQNFIKGKHSIEKCKSNLKKAIDKNAEFYRNRISKKCNLCNEEKPINDFIQEHNECKKCYNKKKREERKNFVETRTELKCRICEETKNIIDFPKHNKSKCKKCTNADALKYKKNKVLITDKVVQTVL